jgi:hypothetical protein
VNAGRRDGALALVVVAAVLVALIVVWRRVSVANREPRPAIAPISAHVVARRSEGGAERRGDGQPPDARRQDAPSNAVAPPAGDVIRGHVKTPTGDPVAGVTIMAFRPRNEVMQVIDRVERAAGMTVEGSCVSVNTDSDGAYALSVDPSSTYSVDAVADGFAFRSEEGRWWTSPVKAGAVVDFTAVDHDSLRRVAVDAKAGDADRISAWEDLCHVRGGFTPDVAEAAADALRTSTSSRVRARAANTLHVAVRFDAIPSPTAFKPALIAALASDKDESVRAEAARCLDVFTGDVAVRQALTNAQSSDASDAVRTAARASADGGR